MYSAGKIFLLFGLLILGAPAALSQETQLSTDAAVVSGSLMELRNKRHVLLLVRRSAVLDSRGEAKSVLTEVYRTDAESPKRFARTYNSIARKLNQYMVKYGSISGARTVSEAQFIIFFNLLEYRRPLGHPYPFGELFVILNERSSVRSPRIIWKTRKNPIWAEDAINEFIKDLKATRGEG